MQLLLKVIQNTKGDPTAHKKAFQSSSELHRNNKFIEFVETIIFCIF
jgi:hypothetical protein